MEYVKGVLWGAVASLTIFVTICFMGYMAAHVRNGTEEECQSLETLAEAASKVSWNEVIWCPNLSKENFTLIVANRKEKQ